MLALPRGGTLRADYSLIAIYLSICAAESQYAGKIVALCKPKSRYGNGGTGCPVCPNRAGGLPILARIPPLRRRERLPYPRQRAKRVDTYGFYPL